MQAHHAEFERRGAQVVAVGQGQGDYAARFCRMLKTDFPCLGDPERRAYRAFDLGRTSVWGLTLGPLLKQPLEGLRRIREADLAAANLRESDVFQLPGVAIVDTDGCVHYAYRGRHTTDLPPTSDLLRALDELQPRA